MSAGSETTEHTPQSTTTTEKFDLVKKYLHDWPPEVGVDVNDAATYGIAFLVLMGLFFTFCIVLDLDFFRRKLKLLRQIKREKDLERLLGLSEKNKNGRNTGSDDRPPTSGRNGNTPDDHDSPTVWKYPENRRFNKLNPPTVLPYHVLDSPPPYTKSMNKDFRAV